MKLNELTEKQREEQITNAIKHLKLCFVEVEEIQSNYVPYTNDINKGK